MLVIYDLETLRDFFLYVDVVVDVDEFNIFEISRFKNDLVPLLKHLKKLKGQIGFNNLSFDAQIQQHIIKNYEFLKGYSGETVAEFISEYANSVVQKSNNNEWLDYREYQFSVKQVDLYRVWHFNNKAKMTSLKWLEYMMDWSPIEDMPVDHNELITDRETADKIIGYCKNDCLATKRLYEISRGKTDYRLYKDIDRFQLRKDIRTEFGFDCTNFDDVKIGDEINKVNYINSTGVDRYDLKKKRSEIRSFKYGDCIPSYVKFQTKEFSDFLDGISGLTVLTEGQQEYHFKYGSTEYVIARGGIHSVDKPRVVQPSSHQILRDADIGSQYPNSINKRRIFPSHLGEKWLDGYIDVINKRIEAKKKYKETKDKKYQSIQEALKLSLNGGSFGKFSEKTNWQYDPFCTFKVTIGNQFEILMLIEALELGGIKVMSANTDGLLSLFDKTLEPLYNKICDDWEVKVGNDKMGKLEFADYKLLAQRSVNDYVAIKNDGEPKHKGASFTINHELHKNKSFRIVSLALDAFYTKGLNPRNFVMNHNNVFDFCAGVRSKGNWYLESRRFENGSLKVEKLQKTNRYYISNNGSKLIKCNPDGREIQQDAGKWYCTIYNTHVVKDIKEYDINYDYYVKQVYDILSEIQPEIINESYSQLSMF